MIADRDRTYDISVPDSFGEECAAVRGGAEKKQNTRA
jgi:hypothetical protein